MSGLTGSISAASKTFNDIDVKSLSKGKVAANYLEEKINHKEKELQARNGQASERIEEEINSAKLAREIQEDMER